METYDKKPYDKKSRLSISFFLDVGLWVKDVALFDSKFGFSMSNPPRGHLLRSYGLGYDDFKIFLGFSKCSQRLDPKFLDFSRDLEVLEGLKSSGRLVGKKST